MSWSSQEGAKGNLQGGLGRTQGNRSKGDAGLGMRVKEGSTLPTSVPHTLEGGMNSLAITSPSPRLLPTSWAHASKAASQTLGQRAGRERSTRAAPSGLGKGISSPAYNLASLLVLCCSPPGPPLQFDRPASPLYTLCICLPFPTKGKLASAEILTTRSDAKRN